MTLLAILLLLIVAVTLAVGVHAGGHAWLLPIPAVVLAAIWAVTASSGDGSGAAAWSLGGAALVFGLAGLLAAAVAAAQGRPAAVPRQPSLPAAEGVTLTALDPAGLVKVAGETWSADSLSGPLAAGSPVHVIARHGLRLQVWSEEGAVPGAAALEAAALETAALETRENET